VLHQKYQELLRHDLDYQELQSSAVTYGVNACCLQRIAHFNLNEIWARIDLCCMDDLFKGPSLTTSLATLQAFKTH